MGALTRLVQEAKVALTEEACVIKIEHKGSWLVVHAPFKASAKEDWKQVIGRRFDGRTSTNWVPVKYRKSLAAILRDNYADCKIEWPKDVPVPSNLPAQKEHRERPRGCRGCGR